MKVTLHPAAERDIAEAAEFYEREASPILAARFVKEFKRVAALLAEHPGIGAPRQRGRRSFGMQMFPYSVVYQALDGGIELLLVRHDRRRPGFGTRRK